MPSGGPQIGQRNVYSWPLAFGKPPQAGTGFPPTGRKKTGKRRGNMYGGCFRINRRLVVGGATHIFPGGSQPFWTRSLEEDDEGLQDAGPQQVDVLHKKNSQSQG